MIFVVDAIPIRAEIFFPDRIIPLCSMRISAAADVLTAAPEK